MKMQNKNTKDITSSLLEYLLSKINVGKGMEKREHLCKVCGNIN
jgi:hypothetical protein